MVYRTAMMYNLLKEHIVTLRSGWEYLIISELSLWKFFKYRKNFLLDCWGMVENSTKHSFFVSLQLFPYENHCGNGPENLVTINFTCSSWSILTCSSNFWCMKLVFNLTTQHNVMIISHKSIAYWVVLFSYII